jgi:hypothetical protein
MSLVFIDGQYSHIRCDADNCAERSPEIKVMSDAGGLHQLGWFVAGGEHRCPEHFFEETAKTAPLYLVRKRGKLVPDPKRLQP